MAEPSVPILRLVDLHLYTTLKAGGLAEKFAIAYSREELAELAIYAHQNNLETFVLAGGSNVLISDKGISGLVILNRTTDMQIEPGGTAEIDSGVVLQELFLKVIQKNLAGLEFAVGIPGTVGGALVSNAGAYRSNLSKFVRQIEIVENGVRKWVDPSFMQFSYRDSILRRDNPPKVVMLGLKMEFPKANPKESYDMARDIQRQRIGKQPPSPSAGSFFKNVNDQELADSLDNLPSQLKKVGIVPAGYLIENCGLKGFKNGGAMVGSKHANFILNVGGASASQIRELACHVIDQVEVKYGVTLEEEVLYKGDWSGFKPQSSFK